MESKGSLSAGGSQGLPPFWVFRQVDRKACLPSEFWSMIAKMLTERHAIYFIYKPTYSLGGRITERYIVSITQIILVEDVNKVEVFARHPTEGESENSVVVRQESAMRLFVSPAIALGNDYANQLDRVIYDRDTGDFMFVLDDQLVTYTYNEDFLLRISTPPSNQ